MMYMYLNIAMPCLEGNHAILIRVVLLLDVFAYIVYAAKHSKPRVQCFISFWLNINLLFIFFLSFMALTNMQMDTSTEYYGIAIASIFSLIQMFSMAETIVKVIVFAMLSMCSQITNTYLPAFLHEKLGLTMEQSSVLTLFIPLITIVVTQFSIVSRTFTTFMVCVVLSWLSVQAVDVFGREPYFSFTAPVCCSPTTYCSIWTSGYELIVLVILIVFISTLCLQYWIQDSCCCCRNKVETVTEEEEIMVEKEETISLSVNERILKKV